MVEVGNFTIAQVNFAVPLQYLGDGEDRRAPDIGLRMRMHCLAAHKLQRGGRESRAFHVPGRCLQEGACATGGQGWDKGWPAAALEHGGG